MALVSASGMPYGNMPAAKSFVPESDEQYMGTYWGQVRHFGGQIAEFKEFKHSTDFRARSQELRPKSIEYMGTHCLGPGAAFDAVSTKEEESCVNWLSRADKGVPSDAASIPAAVADLALCSQPAS